MTSAQLIVGADLLDRAVGYARGAMVGIRPERLHDPTPCAGWDLLDLVEHLDDSMAAMSEAVVDGLVELEPALPRTGLHPLDSLQDRAAALLAAWSRSGPDHTVVVGGAGVQVAVVGLAGALEVTLHGWDVARTLGLDHPVPEDLAVDLLAVAPHLILTDDRGVRFGPEVPSIGGPADRLVAYAGRRP